MKELIPISEIYEYTLNTLHLLPSQIASMVSANIGNLEYVNGLFIDLKIAQKIIRDISNAIKQHNIPVDIMAFSAIVYIGKEKGLNVEPLVKAMNEEAEWLTSEQIKDINNSNV